MAEKAIEESLEKKVLEEDELDELEKLQNELEKAKQEAKDEA